MTAASFAGTARWIAAARARESARPDRLFDDPYAAALAGPAGVAAMEAPERAAGREPVPARAHALVRRRAAGRRRRRRPGGAAGSRTGHPRVPPAPPRASAALRGGPGGRRGGEGTDARRPGRAAALQSGRRRRRPGGRGCRPAAGCSPPTCSAPVSARCRRWRPTWPGGSGRACPRRSRRTTRRASWRPAAAHREAGGSVQPASHPPGHGDGLTRGGVRESAIQQPIVVKPARLPGR